MFILQCLCIINLKTNEIFIKEVFWRSSNWQLKWDTFAVCSPNFLSFIWQLSWRQFFWILKSHTCNYSCWQGPTSTASCSWWRAPWSPPSWSSTTTTGRRTPTPCLPGWVYHVFNRQNNVWRINYGVCSWQLFVLGEEVILAVDSLAPENV